MARNRPRPVGCGAPFTDHDDHRPERHNEVLEDELRGAIGHGFHVVTQLDRLAGTGQRRAVVPRGGPVSQRLHQSNLIPVVRFEHEVPSVLTNRVECIGNGSRLDHHRAAQSSFVAELRRA